MRLFQLSILANLASVVVFGQGILFPEASEKGCQTIDGIDCIFPFTYENITYNGCITLSDPNRLPWCSTNVYPGTVFHITGGGFWGHCSPDCELAENQPKLDEEQEAIDNTVEECKTLSGEDGMCKPASTCVDLSKEDEESKVCSKQTHACCKAFLKNDDQIVQKLASNAENQEKVDQPEDISIQQVEESLIGIRLFNPDELESPEVNVVDSTEDDEDGPTPEQLHLAFNRPRAEVFAIDQTATALLDVTDELKESTGAASIGLRFFDSDTISRIDQSCPWTPAPSCDTVASSKFRTSDGTCNNLKEPNYGRAATPFQRILEAQYSGGSLGLPRTSQDGFELPSPRKLSTSVAQTTANSERTDEIQTVLVMQVGQFIDHDITHTPTHSIASCCNKDGTFPTSFDSNKCYPIQVPSDDPFWQGRLRCMNFARSLSSPSLKCSLELRQQMNQITHWLDASNIYGSSEAATRTLRKGAGGQLKISAQAGSRNGILPTCSAEAESSKISACSGCKHCFFTGDVRANEQLNLIVMHTVWMREHNRIAKFLQFQNPAWEDERLFQETRRIVIAEYQHIIYNEWLPLIVGKELMTTFGLWPLTQGYSSQYLDSFDPRVTNEFATAAFRFGHSLIPSAFTSVTNPVLSKSGKSIPSTKFLSMKDIFFKPQQFQANPTMMDDLIRGLTTQHGDKWDSSFSNDIVNHLFESKANSGGLDLVALNIQRGRDHGLPGYNSYREVCSIGRAQTFDELADYIAIEDVQRLKDLYTNVDDIDLYVGGFLERKHGDSILGPTFKCIIADTFARLKFGDRFFYDLGVDEKTRLTPAQLQEIRKASMARILCDNSERVELMQPQAFKMAGNSAVNELASCADKSAIPEVNLLVFSEGLR